MTRWILLFSLIMSILTMARGFSAQSLPRPWERPAKRDAMRKREHTDWLLLSSSLHERPPGGEGSEQSSPSSSTGDEESSRVFMAASTVDDTVNQDQGATLSSPASNSLQQDAPLTDSGSSVLSSWRLLLGMSRPSNFLGVIIFHVLGTYLGLQAKTPVTGELLRTVLMKPQMGAVLVALLLTSATSMVVNDYYDFRAGVDASKTYKPLVNGQVQPRIAKRFVSFLYATLLLTATVVPGIPARISIMTGAILTFLYTQHLKPITWLKNITCAVLISLAPVAAGAASLAVAHNDAMGILQVSSLWRLFATLLFGFCGREIMMDINDVFDDRKNRVKTVPVKYGRPFASTTALLMTMIMSILSLIGATKRRQYILAGLGSLAQTGRAFQVWRTCGKEADIVTTAVDEGKTTVLMILASFV